MFGTSIIVARSLGPENLGYTKFLLLIITTVAQFGNLGIIDATSYFQRKTKYDIQTIFNVNFSYLILLSFIFISLITILKVTGFILMEYSLNIVLYSAVTLIIFGFLNDLIVATLISKENIYRINNSLLLTSILNLFLLAILWYFELLNVTVYLLIFPLNSLVRTLLMIKKIDFKFSLVFDFRIISEEFKYGFIVFLGALFIFLNYRLDQWIVKIFLGNRELGLYAVGVGIAEIILIIPTSVINPLRARLYNVNSDSEEFKLITAKSVKFAMYTTAVISIPIFFAVNLLSSEYLYGNKYADSVRVVQILLVGIIFLTFGKVGSHYYVVKGKPYVHMYSALFIFILNLSLNIILIPKFGINGAAFSSVISYMVYGFLYVYLYVFVEKIRFSDLFLIRRTEISGLINNFKSLINKA